jgi:hypothetical protein
VVMQPVIVWGAADGSAASAGTAMIASTRPNAYRKLNVRSRSELTRVFARDGLSAEVPALAPSV